MLWLLASESEDGSIDADPKKLAFRLRANEKEINAAIRPLIDGKFFEVVQVASGLIAVGEHFGVSEERREEKNGASAPHLVSLVIEDSPPPELDATAWARWIEYRKGIKKPIKPPSFAAAQRDMATFGTRQAEVVEHTIAKGWTGLRAPDQTKPQKASSGLPTLNPS